MGTVTPMDAVIPRWRDPEFPSTEVDGLFSPSFIDMGLLQTRAKLIAHRWCRLGFDHFCSGYFVEVEEMLRTSVRHVVKSTISPTGFVAFVTQDNCGYYTYGFSLEVEWLKGKE